MVIDHLPDIHPVDVIGAENRHELGIVSVDEIQVLVDGIRSALIPVSSHPHLRRYWRDKMFTQKIGGAPPLLQMLEQRLGFELSEHIDR